VDVSVSPSALFHSVRRVYGRRRIGALALRQGPATIRLVKPGVLLPIGTGLYGANEVRFRVLLHAIPRQEIAVLAGPWCMRRRRESPEAAKPFKGMLGHKQPRFAPGLRQDRARVGVSFRRVVIDCSRIARVSTPYYPIEKMFLFTDFLARYAISKKTLAILADPGVLT